MRALQALCGLLLVAFATALLLPRLPVRERRGPRPVKADLAQIQSELAQFRLECGRYPTTEEGLAALSSPPSALRAKWRGPYTNRPIRNDSWDRPFIYGSDGRTYRLASYGEDGRPGGEGYSADVVEISPRADK